MLPMLEDHREFDISKAMHVPLGVASPLWLPFAAVTSAGLAFWWMTRWTRPASLEATMQGMAPPAVPPIVGEPKLPPAEPLLEVVDTMAEQTEEAAEAAAETMETMAEEPQVAVEATVEAATESAGPIVPPVVKKKAKAAPESLLH